MRCNGEETSWSAALDGHCLMCKDGAVNEPIVLSDQGFVGKRKAYRNDTG